MTNKIKTLTLAAGLFAMVAGAGAAPAAEKLIGTAVYEAKPQRDVVSVGGREGQFRAIRLEVRNSDVEVLDLKVVYGNGAADDIPVRATFKAGSSSRALDLRGGERAVKEIIVTYVARKPAKILFYGVEAAAAPASWERLGCKDVNFGIDHDTLKVGRKDGAFRAIKLAVRAAPVEFYDVRVVFGNGQRQDVRVREVIRPGGETRAIDLAGANRGIDRVELLYRSIPSYKGTAEVCVDGLQR